MGVRMGVSMGKVMPCNAPCRISAVIYFSLTLNIHPHLPRGLCSPGAFGDPD